MPYSVSRVTYARGDAGPYRRVWIWSIDEKSRIYLVRYAACQNDRELKANIQGMI